MKPCFTSLFLAHHAGPACPAADHSFTCEAVTVQVRESMLPSAHSKQMGCLLFCCLLTNSILIIHYYFQHRLFLCVLLSCLI